ncbi:MAG: hypothetical protein WBE78_02045, partial [Candidatus Binataceae bacterium]
MTHSTPMPSRPGALVNPTTRPRGHSELTHFRAPRAEKNLLRVLVSWSYLVPSSLVFLGRGPSKNRVPKKLQKRTHCREIGSIFKEFIFSATKKDTKRTHRNLAVFKNPRHNLVQNQPKRALMTA